jgi:hypothetical protein
LLEADRAHAVSRIDLAELANSYNLFNDDKVFYPDTNQVWCRRKEYELPLSETKKIAHACYSTKPECDSKSEEDNEACFIATVDTMVDPLQLVFDAPWHEKNKYNACKIADELRDVGTPEGIVLANYISQKCKK